jgi:hypothetical protein
MADHVDELEGLPPAQVDALLRRLLVLSTQSAAPDEEKRPTPGAAAQRWKALKAAQTATDTETSAPESSAYEGHSDSSDEDLSIVQPPIRVRGRGTTGRAKPFIRRR